MACRDFEGATGLFLESLSTFTTYELMSYADFVHYTCVCGVITLKRVDLKKLIDSPEVLSVIGRLRGVGALVNALPVSVRGFHARVPGRERRCPRERVAHEPPPVLPARGARAGVPAVPAELQVGDDGEHGGGVPRFRRAFLDAELSNFIVEGRLNVKIDKVNGTLVTNRPDAKNALYQSYIKEGQLAEQDPEAQPRGQTCSTPSSRRNLLS